MNNKEFAVIKVNSKQFIVSEGDTLVLDRITPKSDVEILLLNNGKDTLVGEPSVDDAGVLLEIVEQKQDKKVSVRRFKAKSRYRKNKGHRQPISVVKVKKLGKGVKTEIVLNIREKNTDISKEKTGEEKVEKKVKEEVKTVEKTTQNLIKDVEGLSDSMKEKLIGAGYDTVEKVKKATDKELTSIKGVGQKAVDKLRELIK